MATWNRIVVGVDGSKESLAALDLAVPRLSSAVPRWPPLRPGRCPRLRATHRSGSFPLGSSVDFTDSSRGTARQLAEVAATAHPDVKISQHVLAGNAAATLIEFSRKPIWWLSGPRATARFTVMLIGSVSQHVLAHSACTVAVVR